jgi:hypothetical protein
VLTLVSVGYPFAPCGPDAVGGAEQILSAIDAALVDAGHRSIVIAPEGSICRGELRATPVPSATIDNAMVHVCHESRREHHRRRWAARFDVSTRSRPPSAGAWRSAAARQSR